MVDAGDLKSPSRKGVLVRVQPSAPLIQMELQGVGRPRDDETEAIRVHLSVHQSNNPLRSTLAKAWRRTRGVQGAGGRIQRRRPV